MSELKSDYLLRFWGRDSYGFRQRLSGHSWCIKEPNGAWAAWFPSAKAREAAVESAQLPDEVVIIDEVDTSAESDARLMTHTAVELAVGDERYCLEHHFGFGYPPSAASYMWEEGNYSCDCNKSLFIAEQCDPSFSERDCGDEIALASISVEQIEWP
jgi:hypothetical protein